ncbi:MAG: hypothetical protein JSW61_10475 [Candidatus Thorarchaeota archaeon]|nr:MAG: hypothetical protein JSW61_10475 [Candidatus Thorarchaeota archaeon]
MVDRRAIAATALIALVAVGFVIISQFVPQTVWIEEANQFFVASQKYDYNDNQTFTVTFQGVEFTFHHWFYPDQGVTDLPYNAHFTVKFQDGASENLILAVGGYVVVAPWNPLRPVLTNHTSPVAGVATAHTEELWGHWVYLVSV